MGTWTQKSFIPNNDDGIWHGLGTYPIRDPKNNRWTHEYDCGEPCHINTIKFTTGTDQFDKGTDKSLLIANLKIWVTNEKTVLETEVPLRGVDTSDWYIQGGDVYPSDVVFIYDGDYDYSTAEHLITVDKYKGDFRYVNWKFEILNYYPEEIKRVEINADLPLPDVWYINDSLPYRISFPDRQRFTPESTGLWYINDRLPYMLDFPTRESFTDDAVGLWYIKDELPYRSEFPNREIFDADSCGLWYINDGLPYRNEFPDRITFVDEDFVSLKKYRINIKSYKSSINVKNYKARIKL